MKQPRPPGWLQGVASFGGAGLFALAFLDSSLLSFPLVTDLIVIQAAMHNPTRMPYYATMAALGSVAGSIVLYAVARKGGKAFFTRRAGAHAEKARAWVERNAFLSIFVPSLSPPPMPFKIFILAAGVFQVPLRTFVLALALGRGSRYFAEGILAVHYGAAVVQFLATHGRAMTFFLVAAVVVYLAREMLLRFSRTR